MDVKKFIKSIIAATIFFGVALGLIIWFSTHNSEVAIFIIPLSLVFLGFVANKVFASLKQKELVNGVTIKTPINFVTIAFGLVFIFAGILIIVLAQDTSSILFGVGGIVGGVVIGAWGYMASRNKIVIEETGFTRYHLFGFKHETYAFSEVTSVTNMKGIMFLNAKTKEKKKDWQFEIVGANEQQCMLKKAEECAIGVDTGSGLKKTPIAAVAVEAVIETVSNIAENQ